MKFLDPDTESAIRVFLARIPAGLRQEYAILYGSRARRRASCAKTGTWGRGAAAALPANFAKIACLRPCVQNYDYEISRSRYPGRRTRFPLTNSLRYTGGAGGTVWVS